MTHPELMPIAERQFKLQLARMQPQDEKLRPYIGRIDFTKCMNARHWRDLAYAYTHKVAPLHVLHDQFPELRPSEEAATADADLA